MRICLWLSLIHILRVSGLTNLTIGIPCDRCLEEVPVDFKLDFTREVETKEAEVASDEADQLDENNYIDGYHLDVEKLLYNEILVGWPMKVLDVYKRQACTVVIAKVVGCTLPLIAKRVGLDPAIMATPLISTLVDISTISVYFAIVSAVLDVYKRQDYAEHHDEETFTKHNGLECMECGSCSFVCPAKRQLKQAIGSMRKIALANRKKKK